MIFRQLVLKQLIGTPVPEFVPTTPIAVYTETEIETLITGDNPMPEGVRFHFDRPSGTETVGLVAVCLTAAPIDNTMLRNFEFTSGTKKYVHRTKTSSTANFLDAEGFRSMFASVAFKGGGGGNNSVCVFFSRTDLRMILDQTGVSRIAFFPSTIQRSFTTTPQNFDTLVAIGQTSAGALMGVQIRSELPCPPHCGDDYP
ncbi:MAG: hypothetical protein H7246_00635 [Phycisphaerae bacterium]|nr:hypothetical protein [Saprospiraceae bacterium]